ncbi:hypothetical protein Ciccas_001636 [Cichlidogyrus casuarinus]|uniref:Uncharacterized protein n=1 Tax=Cichlidogyrus casuarinus TaxID=1844966 RepID=A0ABD2QJG4_9PLAT
MDEGADAMGSVITVTVPDEAGADDRVLEVGLGMLGQYTIYEVKFLLSDDHLHNPGVTHDDNCCGLQLIHSVGAFNAGISLSLIRCSYASNVDERDVLWIYVMDRMSEHSLSRLMGKRDIIIEFSYSFEGHELVLRLTTGNVSRVLETYFLKRKDDNAHDQLELIFRATALGKNHGTPSLHVGVHKLGHTPDYEESDVQTEWQNAADDLED